MPAWLTPSPGCRYVSSASLETLGQAFKDATLLLQRNYDIFYEELKLSCYQPQVILSRHFSQSIHCMSPRGSIQCSIHHAHDIPSLHSVQLYILTQPYLPNVSRSHNR